jgi:hypothetical protein
VELSAPDVPTLLPEIPIPNSTKDFLAGRHPVLEAALCRSLPKSTLGLGIGTFAKPMIERLESRIVPALGGFHLSPNHHTAFYDDVDGDHVTVKVSTGELDDHNPGGSLAVTLGPKGSQLQVLDLSNPHFNHANIIFSVVKVPGGDGLANVGAIKGGTNDFGTIVIKGDLGQIDAGSSTPGTLAVKSLTVRSMGRFGMDTQPGPGDFGFILGADLQSDLLGGIGTLKVSSDVRDVYIHVFGAAGIGSVTIGGSLIGASGYAVPPAGMDQQSGIISASGDIRMVKIGGDVRGGDARGSSSFNASGGISAGGKLLSVTIGGSLVGGSGPASGFIVSTGDMGVVKIGRSVIGGTEVGTGGITSLGKLASVTIGGSLFGGSATDSGEITSAGDLGSVKIGHDLIGGSITGSASLDRSGLIESTAGRIGSISLGGSIISGTDHSAGTLTNNASIRAANDLGSLTVKGNLLGNADDGTPGNLSPVIITARGQAVTKPGIDLAIGKISIGGTVELAEILAGYQTELTATNGDAQIGAVTVTGDWFASNLVAGAMNATSGNKTFGDGHDASIGTGDAGITSKIASVVIKGAVIGQPGGGTFGFVAEQIGSFKYNGTSVTLAPGPHTDTFAGTGLAGAAAHVGPSLSTSIDDGFGVHAFEV